MNIKQYFEYIEKEVDRQYEVAAQARAKGIDPEARVEVTKARSLAEKVVGLVSALYPQVKDQKIVDRILALEKEYGSLVPAIALIIAEEVAKEKFCKFEDHHQAVEAGIRVAVAYMTLGVVSSPIEGFVRLKIQKTSDGKDYFAPFYSGPIRSAGGTEAAFSLVIADYLRELFGYARYDPTEDEIKRGVHECYEYHEKITNLQYLPTEEEIAFLMKHLPVQVSGDPSEKKEVYNYKDLPRVETNFIRSGFALVMGEGIALKAPKILARINKLREQGFKLSDWDWLEEFVTLQKKLRSGGSEEGSGGSPYIQDIVAGRPVLSHPSASGGFRIRYGRCRNTGYSALAIHPATMALTNDFIAVGTQLKLESPTKGCTVAVCDSIDGPIVKLNDGSVQQVKTLKSAKEKRADVLEILYLGDLLVPYGDLLNRNHLLCKPGYVEQFWQSQVFRSGGQVKLNVPFDEAVTISKRYSVPLHPSYIFYWSQITFKQFLGLIDWLAHGLYKGKLLLPFGKTERERFTNGKRALELIGCQHSVTLEHVLLEETWAKALFANIGLELEGKEDAYEIAMDELIKKIPKEEKDVLPLINSLSKFEIKDKAGTFVGARMGRPEKAKLRKLTGSPHVLFPVGREGGRLRSVKAAYDLGTVKGDFPIFHCKSCDMRTIYPLCERCGSQTRKLYFCRDCSKYSFGMCVEHGTGESFETRRIDMRHYFEAAKKQTKMNLNILPAMIKGVRGTSSADHSCENLGKGILRAKHNLHVNKDGTIRYDISAQMLLLLFFFSKNSCDVPFRPL